MADRVPAYVDETAGIQSKMPAGDTVAPTSGGTGKATITEKALLRGGAGNTYTEIAPPTPGYILTGDGTSVPVWAPNSGGTRHTATNDNASALNPGAPLYMKADADYDLAQANAIATAWVFGLAVAATAAGAEGEAQADGFLDQATALWDTVTGQTGGLTPGARYWLDHANPGKLLAAPPAAAAGRYATKVGVAASTTVMKIEIEPPIGLG